MRSWGVELEKGDEPNKGVILKRKGKSRRCFARVPQIGRREYEGNCNFGPKPVLGRGRRSNLRERSISLLIEAPTRRWNHRKGM